jgi:hypothetical protein
MAVLAALAGLLSTEGQDPSADIHPGRRQGTGRHAELGTALQAAAEEDNIELVQLPPAAGADVQAGAPWRCRGRLASLLATLLFELRRVVHLDRP